MRKQLSILLFACLLLGACAAPSGGSAETNVQESTAAVSEAASEASENADASESGDEAVDSALENGGAASDHADAGAEDAGDAADQESGADAGNQKTKADTAAGTNALEDASAYAGSIDNSSIDASIYLDYSAGIEAGVYKWIKSEDGSYYTLAFIDENGEPVTGTEAAINVGANNQESIDNGQGAMPEGMPEGMMQGMPEGAPEGMNEAAPMGELTAQEDNKEENAAAAENAASGSENAGKGSSNGQGQGGQGQRGQGGFPDGGHGNQGGKGGFPGGANGQGGGGMGGMGGFPGNQGTVYQGVYMNANITNLSNQTMLVYAPAKYFTTDENGEVTGINHEGKAGNYTADTAPIVYLNECGGWRSSSPRSADTSYLEKGMIYVTAGARSRDAVSEDGTTRTGKAPTQMVDLKSGIIELRANADVIPGDKDRIISVGTSGGGQMSSALGASGNMPEYYEYMYESGVLGVTKNADGTYESVYPDNVYAAQLYCPIADIENADLAYAWWWTDLADDGGTYGGSMTDFERRLQELEADAFIPYLNSLGLKDADGNELTLTGLRSGSYYDAVLQNISDALNAYVEAGLIDPAEAYPDSDAWLTENADGSWSVTDLRGFMIGTGLVNNRNKAIPGFDAMDKSAENNAFGASDTEAVHFSASVAKILQDNYDELSKLDGFDKEQVESYIEEALTGDDAKLIDTQTNLLNATEILLGSDGLTAVDPAEYWRDRSGTADQHTSFSVGYNILLAAQALGKNIDYHLVWDMGHGSNEGSSTGTFIDWIEEICK